MAELEQAITQLESAAATLKQMVQEFKHPGTGQEETWLLGILNAGEQDEIVNQLQSLVEQSTDIQYADALPPGQSNQMED